jgi:uncharacterized protein YkwD
MKKLFIVGLFFLFAGNIFAVVDSTFIRYKLLNDADSALIEYKDNDYTLKLKLAHLNYLNAERKKNKVGTLKLDILASRVANKMAREAATHHFVGHLSLDGLKPYHRYAFAGGKDHVSENASGYWTNSEGKTDSATTMKWMKLQHDGFMKEVAPNDAHKKNCLDKFHTNVGIGFYMSAKDFFYYEEYIDRAFTFESVPDTVNVKQEFTFKVKVQPQQFISALMAYYEPEPYPIDVEDAKEERTYDDFTNVVAAEILPWDMAKLRKGEEYEIKLMFKKPGLYYINLYRDFKEETVKGEFTSKGKMQACGIVIVAK